jgi:hypothetical protein
MGVWISQISRRGRISPAASTEDDIKCMRASAWHLGLPNSKRQEYWLYFLKLCHLINAIPSPFDSDSRRFGGSVSATWQARRMATRAKSFDAHLVCQRLAKDSSPLQYLMPQGKAGVSVILQKYCASY